MKPNTNFRQKKYDRKSTLQTELKENDEVIVDIKRLGINGEGIAFYKKLAVFVDNALPGEGVNVKITKMLNKMAYASVLDYKHKSEFRCEPKCVHYETCGACQTMHCDYEKMLEYKRELVVEAISRYTKLNPRSFEIKKTIGMSNPYGYRYKSSLPLKTLNGKTKVGLIKPDTNVVTTIDNCLNQNEIVNKINNEICKLIDEQKIEVYDPKENKGILKYVVVRVSHYTKEAQVTLVVTKKGFNLKKLASSIMKIEHVVSVFESVNDGSDVSIFGLTSKLEGKDTILENIGAYKFELGPDTFFQLNPVQTENLYEVIKKVSKLSHKETVLDLYCGVGTIGIYLSKLAKKVIGVEANEVSIENAKTNAVINKVSNAFFYAGRVDEILPKLIRENNIDILVCDPPRTGLEEYVCKTILKSDIKKLVYVSCNPATLAKDIDILSSKYNVKSIQPVDMFPGTSHVESITLLELKK